MHKIIVNLEEWNQIEVDKRGTIWVKITAHIRKNSTGEVRSSLDNRTWLMAEGEPSIFWWEEGNASCDCNREIFFERCNKVEIDNEKCGDGRFSVNLSNPVTGKVFYREFE